MVGVFQLKNTEADFQVQVIYSVCCDDTCVIVDLCLGALKV